MVLIAAAACEMHKRGAKVGLRSGPPAEQSRAGGPGRSAAVPAIGSGIALPELEEAAEAFGATGRA
jgi:hypothetical protein